MSAEFPALFHSMTRDPPTELCARDIDEIVKDKLAGNRQDGGNTYLVNGLPVTDKVLGCCVNDFCHCRSNVIFYRGIAYDQKPYINGMLRRRPHDVMYFEGKLVPPFNPGKSVTPMGYNSKKDKYTPLVFQPKDCTDLAYTSLGLPYGETLGFFRFKPDKVCDCRLLPIQRLGECCTCEPGEYNPALYESDECPGNVCCC